MLFFFQILSQEASHPDRVYFDQEAPNSQDTLYCPFWVGENYSTEIAITNHGPLAALVGIRVGKSTQSFFVETGQTVSVDLEEIFPGCSGPGIALIATDLWDVEAQLTDPSGRDHVVFALPIEDYRNYAAFVSVDGPGNLTITNLGIGFRGSSQIRARPLGSKAEGFVVFDLPPGETQVFKVGMTTAKGYLITSNRPFRGFYLGYELVQFDMLTLKDITTTGDFSFHGLGVIP